MRSRLALSALVLAATALGACRSDGGIGRYDSERSRVWTADRMQTHHKRDVVNTQSNLETLSDLAGITNRSFESARTEWAKTWSLYIEGSTTPLDR